MPLSVLSEITCEIQGIRILYGSKIRTLKGGKMFTSLIVDFIGFDYTKGLKFGPFEWEAFVTFYCRFWRNCLSQGSKIRILGLGKR